MIRRQRSPLSIQICLRPCTILTIVPLRKSGRAVEYMRVVDAQSGAVGTTFLAESYCARGLEGSHVFHEA